MNWVFVLPIFLNYLKRHYFVFKYVFKYVLIVEEMIDHDFTENI